MEKISTTGSYVQSFNYSTFIIHFSNYAGYFKGET